jgi:hypothetical protein
VYALAVSGSDLYAGGLFTTAGGGAANYIAKWNPAARDWSALGSGMNDAVRALAVSGNDVYAGGNFTMAGCKASSAIARWDGNSWSPLGSGVAGGVDQLAIAGAELYARGNFTTAGGKVSYSLARARIGSSASSVVAANSTSAIQFSGVIGYTYNVQRATSLNTPITWTTVTSSALSPASDGSFTFTDTTAPPGTAYYRAVETPRSPVLTPEISVEQPAGTRLNNGSSLDFGVVALGSSSAAKTFTITNSGTGTLTISSLSAAGGDNPADFVMDASGLLTSVPPGGSTTFTITFSPTAADSRTTDLLIRNNSVNACGEVTDDQWFIITLTGTGMD